MRYRGKTHLGWVPLKGRDLKETPVGFHFNGREFRVFKSRPLPAGASIKDGSNFSQDSRGNWFLNVCIEVPDGAQRPIYNGIGIDLGLNDFAVHFQWTEDRSTTLVSRARGRPRAPDCKDQNQE